MICSCGIWTKGWISLVIIRYFPWAFTVIRRFIQLIKELLVIGTKKKIVSSKLDHIHIFLLLFMLIPICLWGKKNPLFKIYAWINLIQDTVYPMKTNHKKFACQVNYSCFKYVLIYLQQRKKYFRIITRHNVYSRHMHINTGQLCSGNHETDTVFLLFFHKS